MLQVRVLLNGWFPPLRSIEGAILDCVAEKLPSDIRDNYRAQVRGFNLVQRSAKDKECNFYCIRRGKPFLPLEWRLPIEGEHILAKVAIRSIRLKEVRLTAEVCVVNGFVFSILFQSSPREVGSGDFAIDSVHVHLVRHDSGPFAPADDGALIDALPWLADVISNRGKPEVKPPLAASLRETLESEFDVQFPSDYLQLLAYADGLRIGPMVVHGLSAIRQIATGKENLYVLAEWQGEGCICIRRGAARQTVLVDIEDDTIEDAGSEFHQALVLLKKRYASS